MRSVIIGSSFLLLAVVLAGCGGGSGTGGGITTDPNKVTSVNVSPNAVSLNAGDVVQVSASAANSNGSLVTATFTYSSSNIGLITVSPTGLVCGGVWDSAFVVCNGKDGLGNPLQGKATITASAQGVTSAAIPVAVHPTITSITVAGSCTVGPGEPSNMPCCTSTTKTQQFTATAFHNGGDITPLVGPFTWSSTNTPVGTVDNNGLVAAHNSGLTGISASNTTVSSPTVFFRTCMPLEIRLHVPGNLPPTSTTVLTQNQTLQVEADTTDELGFVMNSAPVLVKSNNPAVATISGTTVTAASFGGAGFIASCTPTLCGGGVNNPVYSNLFQIVVPGTSPTTTVYAATTFAPFGGTSSSIIPIDTSAATPVAGTAITLPGVANSFVIDAVGDQAYLGTTAGLVRLDTSANTVALVATNILGKVLAVSNDGNSVIVSDAVLNPPPAPGVQRLFVFDRASSTFQVFIVPGAAAATFDNDGFRAYVSTNSDGGGNVYVVSPAAPPLLSLVTKNIGGASKDIASLAQGPFVYIANSSALSVLATCNNAQQPDVVTTSAPQFVKATANDNVIVVANATGLDIETATTSSILSTHPFPFTYNSASCVPQVSYSNNFVDFGLGAFTARQLLVSSSSVANGATSVHFVVLPMGINKVLTAAPSGPPVLIPLHAGATEALSGGMTPDGNKVWVGVAGTNDVHLLDLTGGTDVLQVAMPFKDTSNNPAPPNLVVVKPK